jgi:hypothetical protein
MFFLLGPAMVAYLQPMGIQTHITTKEIEKALRERVSCTPVMTPLVDRKGLSDGVKRPMKSL